MSQAQIELRIVPDLAALWQRVIHSSLEFSGMRLRKLADGAAADHALTSLQIPYNARVRTPALRGFPVRTAGTGPAAETRRDHMPRIVTTATRSLVATVIAAAALAATSTAGNLPVAPGGSGPQPIGGLSAGPGCSSWCITSAVVTATASSASVKVTTTVPTSTTVSVRKLDQKLGLAAGPQPIDKLLPSFQTVRTVLFPGLQPETSYRIAVTARDQAGNTETRTGTFKTRAVKVAVDLPPLGLSAGLGCTADCIASGTATAHPSEVGRVDFDVRLTEPGRAQLDLYRSNGQGGLTLAAHDLELERDQGVDADG